MSKYLLGALPKSLEKYNPSLAQLANFFKEEFDERASDLVWLAGATQMLQEALMVKDGVIPPWFTHKAICAKCGPVMIADEIDKVQACVWCQSEKKPITGNPQKEKSKKSNKLLGKYI